MAHIRQQFVFVSNQVAVATGSLTEWVCKGGARLPVAVARPTNGPEYVALSTMAEGSSSRPTNDDDATEKPASPPPPPSTIISKILDHVQKDLRYKFALIVLGLWALNQVYPSDDADGHILPTH